MQTYTELTKETENELVQLLTTETWPYHGTENPTEEAIKKSIAQNNYTNEGTKTFFIQYENQTTIGMLRLFDLEDPSCLFDLRLKQKARGQNRGPQAVKWLTQYAFTNYPHLIRIEGHTRHDNLAMRKTFHNSGYVKEAYHRSAWPQNDKLFDSVGYAITRTDWEATTTTPIHDTVPF
ncbi:acetyltransferase [Bacillus sp. LL01]|uniref:GNAT family N-acetyltransferase n=1 Tax=Bacillus sp. LL01 TaxID=1665556 RepID=UPI00064D53DB|nr:GNAT family protein [Bacillus sp. LL01]KMJ57258.1 acetyltransferase [Bacillus sp. LL01]